MIVLERNASAQSPARCVVSKVCRRYPLNLVAITPACNP
jgi:hypothetical protein